MKIFKYELKIADEQTINMPRHAIVISVANQRGALTIWAMVDPKAEYAPRRFFVHGTGHEFIRAVPYSEFVGSVAIEPFVWHVFAEVDNG